MRVDKNLFRLSLLTLLVVAVSFVETQAQQEEDEPLVINDDSPIIKAAKRYKPKPKFFVFGTEMFSDFKVKAFSDLEGDENAIVSQNLIRELKLKFPLVLKQNTNLIGGFGYRHEQFKFSNQTDPEYPLFARFDNRSLKRITFSTYYKKDLSEIKFLFLFFNSSLNSDKPSFNYLGQQLKLSITGILGKKKGPNKQLGWGASFGYDFGEPAIFPLFLLNNDFSLHWGYEILLPKSVKLRYSPNESNHFISTLELQGASYHLRDSVLTGFNELEFRRSSVGLAVTYEKEIHDWLWFGITTGYRIPINIFVSEPQKRRNDALITVEAGRAPYLNLSLFLVPPSKLYNRAKGSG